MGWPRRPVATCCHPFCAANTLAMDSCRRRAASGWPHPTARCPPLPSGRDALPPLDALDHSEQQIACNLAHARGYLGSGAEYLYLTITGRIAHQIHDPYLERIKRLFAEEINRWPPGSSQYGGVISAAAGMGLDLDGSPPDAATENGAPQGPVRFLAHFRLAQARTGLPS